MLELSTLISPLAAIVGVLVGGLLTTRTQSKIHRQSTAQQILNEKQEACVEFLAAIRSFRRFAMYSPSPFDKVESTEQSKGVVTFEGRAEYDARMDAAAARLMIIVHSDALNRFAGEMRTALNQFLRARADYGRGEVPTEIIKKLQGNEDKFAQMAVEKLHGVRLTLDDNEPT